MFLFSGVQNSKYIIVIRWQRGDSMYPEEAELPLQPKRADGNV